MYFGRTPDMAAAPWSHCFFSSLSRKGKQLPTIITMIKTHLYGLLFNAKSIFNSSKKIHFFTIMIQTLRSLIAAVICDPSAPLFIMSSHCVVITRAGASARVRSATNTISGLRTTTCISVFDTTAGAAADSSREYQRKISVRQQHTLNPSLIQLFLTLLFKKRRAH